MAKFEIYDTESEEYVTVTGPNDIKKAIEYLQNKYGGPIGRFKDARPTAAYKKVVKQAEALSKFTRERYFKRLKPSLKIIASGRTFLLIFPNSQPLRTTKDKAQVYFKRMHVIKKYYSKKYKGKVYHLANP